MHQPRDLAEAQLDSCAMCVQGNEKQDSWRRSWVVTEVEVGHLRSRLVPDVALRSE